MELTDTKLGTSLYFNGTKIKVRDTGTKEEDDSSYKKITFKHFGLPDGTYQGVKLGTANLKSMDQVAVVGKVKFLMDKQEIRLLSTNDTGYLSIASVGIWNKELQVTDWTSNNQTKLGTIKVGQEVDLRITFKYVGQDVVIKYYIDGELRAAHVAKNVVSKLQMTLLVIPKGKGLDLISDPVVGAGINLPELPGKVIITEEDFKQSTPEELGYKEITLSSFGLEDDVSYGKLKKAEHTTASYVRPSLNNTYGEATLAKICMDYGKAATKGVKRAGQGAQVVCAALTGTERGKSFLRACYRYIEVQQDKDPGSYFSILNWHPYVFYTYGTGGPVGTTEDWEGWQEEWVNFQKDYYQIAVDAGDRGRPVWFTEFGVTDCGRYNTKEAGWPTMGPVTEKMAADRLMQMLDLTERELPYVETSFIFRITDLGDQFFPEKSELANFVYNYEANFGLVESFDDCRSANAVLKESGKALYRRMNPEAADLTKIYQMLERHYQQYQNRMKKAKEQEFDGVVNGFELCDPEIMKKK